MEYRVFRLKFNSIRFKIPTAYCVTAHIQSGEGRKLKNGIAQHERACIYVSNKVICSEVLNAVYYPLIIVRRFAECIGSCTGDDFAILDRAILSTPILLVEELKLTILEQYDTIENARFAYLINSL